MIKLGPIRPVDLAAGMNIDASTLSRNLKPMVAAGWLSLEAGGGCAQPPGNSRPTPDARSAIEAQRRWRVAQEGINATLGPQRVIALHALIDEAMQALDEG